MTHDCGKWHRIRSANNFHLLANQLTWKLIGSEESYLLQPPPLFHSFLHLLPWRIVCMSNGITDTRRSTTHSLTPIRNGASVEWTVVV